MYDSKLARAVMQAESSLVRGGAAGASVVALGGKADYGSKNAAGKHDLEIIVASVGLGHGGDQEGQEHADGQSEKNSQCQ